MTNATVVPLAVLGHGNYVPLFGVMRSVTMISKEAILHMKNKAGSWRRLAQGMNLPPMTLWRYAIDPTYEPKREDIRKKLGADPEHEIIVRIQEVNRDAKGRFTKYEGEATSAYVNQD